MVARGVSGISMMDMMFFKSIAVVAATSLCFVLKVTG